VSGTADLDLTALLAPLPGDQKTGRDPREDLSPQSLFLHLRDARNEARGAERQLEGSGLTRPVSSDDPDPIPRWRRVRDIAVRILSERAKDVEVAAWLTDALVRTSGLQGMATGSAVLLGLVQRYWDDGLYPAPDEDEGIGATVAAIGGLNGTDRDGSLLAPLRNVTLLHAHDGTEVSFLQYQQVEVPSRFGPPRDLPPLADLQRDARAEPASHFASMRDDLEAALANWTALEAVLSEKAGADAPPLSRVKAWLEEARDLVNRFAPQREAEPASVAAEATRPAEAAPSLDLAQGNPVTREHMLGQLARIAEYFRRAEPQSPLSLTLDEAVRRARLSWPELLAEVVPSADQRNAMLSALGIRPVSPPEE
jgi:type VI secretion system protein ImpA